MSTGSSWNTDLDGERLHMERDEFLALHDTPPLYTGSAGKQVVVNDNEDALVFENTVSSFLDLTDTPGSYVGQATKYARVNTGSSALEFADAPGGDASGEIQGVLIHDEGVFLGTGTIINVVGDYISASLSGSVAKIERESQLVSIEKIEWVKHSGTSTLTANNTWEMIPYLTGTIDVDRACDLLLQLGTRWWTASSNFERCELQFELDGTQSGIIWYQTKDANVTQGARWFANFAETFEVQSGTHGFAIYSRDGGASGDRGFSEGLLLVEAVEGDTWQ